MKQKQEPYDDGPNPTACQLANELRHLNLNQATLALEDFRKVCPTSYKILVLAFRQLMPLPRPWTVSARASQNCETPSAASAGGRDENKSRLSTPTGASRLSPTPVPTAAAGLNQAIAACWAGGEFFAVGMGILFWPVFWVYASLLKLQNGDR